MKELAGLATGIGSLPYKDAQKAVELVLKYCPQVPFWPQLPKRDLKEGMVAQFVEGLPCLQVNKEGAIFNPKDKESALERFYEAVINADREHFKISRDYAAGLYVFHQRLSGMELKDVKAIKCHITGPFTFAAAFNDEKNISLLYDGVFMQAVVKGLSMKALWQIDFFKQFGKRIILFIDEPYLACFGSGYTPVTREEVTGRLQELAGQIKEQSGALIGVHCCGNTDWSIFTDIDSVDMINFDAFGFLDKLLIYARELEAFFARGGALCWGVVPTQEPGGEMNAHLLLDKIKRGIDSLVEKGLKRELVCDNLLLSPACGLGATEEAKAERALKLLSQLSAELRGGTRRRSGG